ncbi:hypothetical protein EPN81_04190 [Patescibacteria group bacterium]|nr:MAG: hypothetical protein EPN81_04190 [Patescibacteria group bacterium]
MSWSRLANILQTRPLDRETKLMIIDLLAAVDDKKLEEEIFSFVFAWEEAEAQTQRELVEGIKRVTNEYELAKATLDAGSQKSALSIADDIARQKRIEDLRVKVETLWQ